MDMDNAIEGISWIGSIYRKFEAMCSEVDDIMREYIENQSETVGDNVKQFCSDLEQEPLPQSSVGTEEGAPHDSTLGQKIGKVKIDVEHFEKEIDSCCMKLVKVSLHDSEEKQLDLEISGGVTPEKKVLCPKSDDLLENNSLTNRTPDVVPSSDSDNLVTSCGVEVLDIEVTSDDASAESIRKSHNSTDDIINVGSSQKLKLDESCILVDRSELSSVSHEAERHGSYKKIFKKTFTEKMRASKKDQDWHAWYGSSDLGSCQQEEGCASSIIAPSNHQICESDWEII
ncbi:uncharacterized protein LOC105649657 isoform X2 [Jatropha curcas]|nr:uncharacterized protein LOC105649657 isoform X2 [Jatropha curcas]